MTHNSATDRAILPSRPALDRMRRQDFKQALVAAEQRILELQATIKTYDEGNIDPDTTFFSLSPANFTRLMLRLRALEAEVASLHATSASGRYASTRAQWKKCQAQWPNGSKRFMSAVRQAFLRGHNWDLDPETYHRLADQPCSDCGAPTGNGIGLDRIDHKRGYEEGNVRPCCGSCNVRRGRKPLI